MNRDRLRYLVYRYYEDPLSSFFCWLGFSANGVTYLGLVIIAFAAYFISQGYLLIGGIVVFFGSALDLIDGAIARKKGTTSKFGALLDSVSDRFQEAFIFFGLIIYYSANDCDIQALGFGVCNIAVWSTNTAFVSSVMISYLRARSEGLGIECKIGIMTRPERVAIIGTGLIFTSLIDSLMIFILIGITVVGFVTTLQRILHSAKMIREDRIN